MSAIDTYKHEIIGVVRCPSLYPLVYGIEVKEGEDQRLPIYRLLENIPADENEFDGRKGDLLVGAGGGEAPALRISLDIALGIWTEHPDYKEMSFEIRQLAKAFWTMNDAFYFGDGFRKAGWDGIEQIETWIMEHILAFIQKEYGKEYTKCIGPVVLEKSGNICRLPTEAERKTSYD